MENNKFKKGIKEIKNITMTDNEKAHILGNILKISKEKPKTKTSPWVSFSFLAILKNNRLVYYVVVPLIIILSSSGVVFASQSSLPDSILYPLKVNVVEPLIEGALTFSPKNKAKYEVNLATKRLVEAETLAGQGKLDKKNEDKINNLLDKHTVALDQTLKNVQKTDRREQSDKIISNFNFEMNTHAQVLDNIKNMKNDNHEENQISKNAKRNAENINNKLKNKEDNSSFNKESKSKDKNRGEKGND
ncbi:MAG: DUF5667 domain-containing protein [Candidatus Paceibacterota bacterium]